MGLQRKKGLFFKMNMSEKNHTTHSFSVQLATEIGLEECLILQHFLFGHQLNAENQDMLKDGYIWFFTSRRNILTIFPYLTEQKLKTAINKLLEGNYIIKGNYSNNKMLKTNWYALTEKTLSLFGENNCPVVNSTDDWLKQPTKDNNIYNNNIYNKETKTINSFSKEKSSNYPLTNPTNVVKGSTKTEGINLKNQNSHEVTLSPHTTPAPPSLTREEREDKFRAEAEMYEAEYGERMIRAFCDYWTEFGGKKMRFEKEKTWELKRRLQTWKRNDEERKARYTRQQAQPQAQYSEVPTMDAKKYIEEYEKKHRF